MNDKQHPDPARLLRLVWTAMLRQFRLRHVGCGEDSRVFVFRSINWRTQDCKVSDVATGEVFRYPWRELEFLHSVKGDIPGLA
jgi:hypothetical protein